MVTENSKENIFERAVGGKLDKRELVSKLQINYKLGILNE